MSGAVSRAVSLRQAVHAVVEELVRDYTSPTLLVNGFNVTGYPRPPEGQTACSADLLTEEQILAALRDLSVLSCGSATQRSASSNRISVAFRNGQACLLRLSRSGDGSQRRRSFECHG